jgi:hypothetical protein
MTKFLKITNSGPLRRRLFPNVDMVAFPKRDRNGQDNDGSVTE